MESLGNIIWLILGGLQVALIYSIEGLRYSDMAYLKRKDIVGDTMYITTMKPYIDIAEKTKAGAMKLFERELSK